MASENWVDLKIPFKITLHVLGFRAGLLHVSSSRCPFWTTGDSAASQQTLMCTQIPIKKQLKT